MAIDTIEKLQKLEDVKQIPIYIGELKDQNISEDLKLKDFISCINGIYYATGYIYNVSRFTMSDWIIKDDCGRSIDIKKYTLKIKYFKEL